MCICWCVTEINYKMHGTTIKKVFCFMLSLFSQISCPSEPQKSLLVKQTNSAYFFRVQLARNMKSNFLNCSLHRHFLRQRVGPEVPDTTRRICVFVCCGSRLVKPNVFKLNSIYVYYAVVLIRVCRALQQQLKYVEMVQ